MAGMDLGQYTHLALSMHIYTGGDAKTDERVSSAAAAAVSLPALPIPMPPMPKTSFEELQRLTQWESEVRYDAKGINVTNYREYVARCRNEFQPYWAQLGLPLLAYVLFVQKKISAAMTVLEHVEEPLRAALINHDMVRALSVPGLEEEPVLLESRLNLIRYTDGASVGEARREALWRVYHADFVGGLVPAGPNERRRQAPVSVREWEGRDREFGQRELF